MKAMVIKASGETYEVVPANGTDFQLDELQKIVGGYIECVNCHDGRLMVINEEGKLNRLPFNAQATDLYEFGLYDPIVGDVLVCGREMVQ